MHSWPPHLGQRKPPLSYPSPMPGINFPKPHSVSLVKILPLVDTRTNSSAGKAGLDTSHEKSPDQQTQMGMGRAKVGAVSTNREYLGFVCQISAAAVGLVWPS